MRFVKIELEKKGFVATICLNRPETLNALDGDLLSEIEQTITEINKDNSVRAVIITGKGRAFSAGADLKHVKGLIGHHKQLLDFLKLVHRVMNALESCPKPIIAAVNGFALAGGLEIVQACDIVIAAEDARLGDQHTNYGLVPGGGGTQRLPRLIGIRKAKELLFTGDWISAAEAQKAGLVNQVVPADRLMETAMELAARIAEKSPLAIAMIKNLVNKGMQTDLATALELELNTMVWHFDTEDVAEGIEAFEKKRKPIFKGR